MPRGPEIPLAIRHVAIAYFFDLDMRQTDICDRLGISKQSLSVLISRTKERCPTYSDPEKAGPTAEELNMLCTAAAVKQRSGRPRRADGGGRCSHCGAPRLRTKKAKKAAAAINAAAAAAAGGDGTAGGSGAVDATDALDGEDDDDEDDDDADGDGFEFNGAASTLTHARPPPAAANDGAEEASSTSGGGGSITLPPITTSAASASAPATAGTTAYQPTTTAYPPGPLSGVSMVNGIVSQGGGSWFYGHHGWEMYGRRDVGGGDSNSQAPSGQNGDFTRQY